MAGIRYTVSPRVDNKAAVSGIFECENAAEKGYSEPHSIESDCSDSSSSSEIAEMRSGGTLFLYIFGIVAPLMQIFSSTKI